MDIVNIDGRNLLNNFVVQEGQSNFLQSWEWGEFQKGQGRHIWRLGIEDKGDLILSLLLIKKNLPLGKSYLYCPRGPVISNFESRISNFELQKIFFEKIKEIGKREGAIFFRFDFPYPLLPNPLSSKVLKAPIDIQPCYTLVLDIQKPEKEILNQMKSKTRYNIRLAYRKGVRIRQSLNRQDLNKFWELLLLTAKRNNFKSHPKAYYEKMVKILGKRDLLRIFKAEYKGETLVASIVLFFGKRATYLHGASQNKHRNVMAPHLLQWEAILEAKRRGCEEYDLWGVVPEKEIPNSPPAPRLRRAGKFPRTRTPKESKLPTGRASSVRGRQIPKWEGITRFKKGFGGKEVKYAGTYDLVLERLGYKIYRIAHKFL